MAKRRKSLAIKLSILIVLLLAAAYFLMPNINIILAKLDKKDFQHITIFYSNDIHGQIMLDQLNKKMSMANKKYLIDKYGDKDGNTILLDGGDTFFGSNEEDLNDGIPLIEIMNKMHFRAMAVGNHEFDFGFEKSQKLFSMAQFPILSCNLYYKNSQRLCQPYTVIDVNGTRLGVIGLSTADTLIKTKPEYVSNLMMKGDEESISNILPELKQKCDFIILLAHEHLDTLRDIAAKYPEIGLIIEGHDHQEVSQEKVGKNAIMVSSGCYAQKLGRVDLVFNNKKLTYEKGSLISFLNKKEQDPEILSILNYYHDKIDKELYSVIGTTEIDLGDTFKARYQECTLGNAVADAMREATGADIALQNGGGVRTFIPKGDINMYKVNEGFPFINYVIEVEMNGRDIKVALEHGLERWPEEWNGGFLQVSGIQYVFDASKPSGKRLLKAMVNGKDIDENKIYRVAINDFLYHGGDEYAIFTKQKLSYNTGKLIKEVFAEYVKAHKTINPQLEGRIKALNSKI